MTEKHYLNLVLNEIKNFEGLQKQFGYIDLDDLIAHYVEEGVITSKRELTHVLKTIKKRLGIFVKGKTFDEWWIDKRRYTITE